MFKNGLQYPKDLWILAIGMMISVTGNSFLWPLTTIYITGVLGHSVAVAGWVLMIQAAAGMIGSLLGGALYDRIGGKKTILVGVSISILAVISIAFTRELWVYTLLLTLFGFSNGLYFPACYAMAGGVWPEGGSKAFNVMYVSQNIGVALGTALGGMVAEISFTLTFLANALFLALFLSVVWFGLSNDLSHLPRGTNRRSDELSEKRLAFRENQHRFLSLLILCIGFMACWLSYSQWVSSIAKYMTDLNFALSSYSLLWTINGLMIILIQPISTPFKDKVTPSIRSQLLVGGAILSLSFVAISQFQFYAGFVISMVILTIGEIFVWPAVPAAAAKLSPKGKAGFYQGMVNSFSTAGKMVGPLIGGILFDTYGPSIMFYVMVAICIFACISFASFDYFQKRSQQIETPLSHDS